MIIKSVARSEYKVSSNSKVKGVLEVNEKCGLCDNPVETGRPVLRRRENGRIICLPCIVDIAELS